MSFPFEVRAIVQMGRSPWAGSAAEDDDDSIVEAAMAEADVLDLADRRFPTLSGGEKARVALARVLAQGTQLLLLDEPTAALDLHHQEHVLTVARARVAAGLGAVVVLHDLGLAAAFADRVVVLSDGRVVADGPPVDVCTAALLSDVYRHEVEVLPHPRTGTPLVLPLRS
jgi:iron complex transport system ATP-binding protein